MASGAPVLAFVTTRALLVLACYACLTLFPVTTIEPWQVSMFPGNNWVDGWVRWDSMWYYAIIDGEARFLPQGYSSANFFPLYAWTSWVVSQPFRVWLDPERAFYAGGLLVSNGAFLIGLIGVHRLASALAGGDAASRTVWLIAFFPFSFFFSAVYADALYFCLAVWTVILAHAGRWSMACALAALAAMTRIPGLALFPALLLMYLHQHGWRVRAPAELVAPGAILAVAPAVLGGYFWMRYGDPLEFVHARQVGWGRAAGLFTALVADVREYTAGTLLGCASLKECFAEWDLTRKLLGYWYLALIPASLALVLARARTLGPGMVVWVVLSIVMAMMNGLDGMGRFTAVLFPAFIAAATLIRTRAALLAVCAGFVPFLLLFLFQFARWRPVL